MAEFGEVVTATTIAPVKRSWVVGIVGFTALALLTFVVWPRSESNAYNSSAQNFVLPKLAGNGTVQLSQFRGKPVVVDLFASWCTACQDELPILSAEAKKLRGKVVFVGVDSQDTGDGLAMTVPTPKMTSPRIRRLARSRASMVASPLNENSTTLMPSSTST